jgi:hypothetical protein
MFQGLPLRPPRPLYPNLTPVLGQYPLEPPGASFLYPDPVQLERARREWADEQERRRIQAVHERKLREEEISKAVMPFGGVKASGTGLEGAGRTAQTLALDGSEVALQAAQGKNSASSSVVVSKRGGTTTNN